MVNVCNLCPFAGKFEKHLILSQSFFSLIISPCLKKKEVTMALYLITSFPQHEHESVRASHLLVHVGARVLHNCPCPGIRPGLLSEVRIRREPACSQEVKLIIDASLYRIILCLNSPLIYCTLLSEHAN